MITGPDDRQARQPGSPCSTDIEVRDQQLANPFAARAPADLVPRRHSGHRERTEHLPHSGPVIDRHQELALDARQLRSQHLEVNYMNSAGQSPSL